MTPEQPLRSRETLDVLQSLLERGIHRISILIRHSERHFSDDPVMEPFMELTDPGRQYAFDLGRSMKPDLLPRLSSSFMGRCIETAYLLDKGFSMAHGRFPANNRVDRLLSPFYVRDIDRTVRHILELGNDLFIRNWFDGRIDETMIENPQKTADQICAFMIDRIRNLDAHEIAVCVSHDWNIYPVKEFKLGLKHETWGRVGYLESVFFFEDRGRFFVTGFQAESAALLPVGRHDPCRSLNSQTDWRPKLPVKEEST